jgi:tetratricopeptide (TPR) repeat protein
MYEGIEDIYRLLDAGRLKEALTQLQGISTNTNHWDIRNQIENALTGYGYMLQYARQGMDDPNRAVFYRQMRCKAYELTDATHIALLAQKTSAVFYDTIRTFALHPAKTYSELQMQLEAYTEEMTTAPLLYTDEKRRKVEMEKADRMHESALAELFNKTWVTIHWTDTEANEAGKLLESVLVHPNDLAVMVSAITLGLLRVFDAKKLHFLMEAYRHENLQVNQRAIVGIIIAISKHEKRIQLYPEIVSRLSLLCEEEGFRKNLYTIQMQLLITRETSKIDKKMREEILPEMMKNAKHLSDPKFRFDESEDPEDRNPEWEEWMDKSGMNNKIKEMSEWQMAGADVYMSSFAQLKHYPFFYPIVHWFYPFDLNLPLLAPIKKSLGGTDFTPLKLIVHSDFFCNSDKYSFALAILTMPQAMRDLSLQQMEGQVQMNEEHRNNLEQVIQKKKEAKGISRQYIQDLYRFFKLWRKHQEEEDIFRWSFNLWENQLFGQALQGEEITKELADYLLQKEYLDEAYTLFKKLMTFDTKRAEVYQKAGYILQKQKQYADAIRHYEHADILLPDNVWTNKHLAQCYKLDGNLPKALEYYRKVEAVQPDNLNIALQIGQCLARMEQHTDALAYFYKVEYLEKNPDNARRAIAWCSFVSGKHEEALKYYRLLLDGSSPKANDWMNIGHVYFAMHQVPQAIQHYQQAQSSEKSHSDFIEKFNKDRNVLLTQGLTEEDLQIMLDLLL